MNVLGFARDIVYTGRKRYFEWMLGRVFRNAENASIVFDFPEFNGLFSIGCRSHLARRILREGVYEPRLARLVRSILRPGMDFVDVGANVGFFSVLASKIVAPHGRVLAIEPTAGALQSLRANLLLNDVNQIVDVFEGVASDGEGDREINVIDGREEYSSIGQICHVAVRGERTKSHPVEGSTIDAIVSKRGLSPEMLKIDTEGHEYQVVFGAMKTLSEIRPCVLLEISEPLLRSNGSSTLELLRLFSSQGYVCFDPNNAWVEVSGPHVGDGFALPAENAELLTKLRSIKF